MALLSTLALQLQAEEVKLFTVLLRRLLVIAETLELVAIVVLLGPLVGHVDHDFALACQGLGLLLLLVDLLVQDLVREANDPPPENVFGDLVQLLGEFVEHS